ncbi:MAG: (E)-4-hydroxy-3-methylbut-2-enyl-diphosphate synthase [Chitinophagales bacterium]|nr:(E)-4-hydroxy-3-methylbut-2-enyl-diphosphate synthase [Chitinophagales bacterium]
MIDTLPPANSITAYGSFVTREVRAGSVIIGGNNPLRIQSMTTTDTMDTLATVEQSIRLITAGCELVRITAPSIREAQNLKEIKKELQKRGYSVPLVADIHFTPNAAETAARIVEKVRINPGNYADKKRFQTIEYTESEYQSELDRIRDKFLPLIRICKDHGTAMRIGTNHGSLSDRILSRFGDTPLGMVESAFEFLKIAEDEKYFDIVLSMKSSNPQVMVRAYRLLVNKMVEAGRNYPLHLGVTEAGDGEDGRIKSALGIGTLLEDGLGDTIRVSLTEEPEYEIPVAKILAKRYPRKRESQKPASSISSIINPVDFKRRSANLVVNIGNDHVPVVIGDSCLQKEITPEDFIPFGYRYNRVTDKWNISDMAADYIFAGDHKISFELPGTLGLIENFASWKNHPELERSYPLFSVEEFLREKSKSAQPKFILIKIEDGGKDLYNQLKADANAVVILSAEDNNSINDYRRVFFDLNKEEVKNPVIIRRNFSNISQDELMLYASADFGALLLDGFGDGIWLAFSGLPPKTINSISFGILQGTRQRISKTEYISCPSCGRTLFDLQETTAKIRARTNHLKGVKIAIMGCIVNGPGEMADADYGYVGSGIGKITLYKGKEIVKRAVNTEVAVDELIDLIKLNGDWVEEPSMIALNVE